MNLLDPLLVFYEPDPDHTFQDQLDFVERTIQCNQAIIDVLGGSETLDYACDMIRDSGFDVDDWIDTTTDNLEFVLEAGFVSEVEPEEISTLITVPRYGFAIE